VSAEFRDALVEVVRADRWRSDCGEGTADAILVMPEMQELLAHERRLDAAVTLWGKALEDQAAHIATLTADLAAERAEVERLRAALRLAGFFPWWNETAELAAVRAEIERLRAAGDALAEVADEWPELVEAWQEARRER
jgi:hypothetical protein